MDENYFNLMLIMHF